MSFLEAKDIISGQEGRAYATITDPTTNVKTNEEMFFVRKLEAKVEKEKSEVKTLGRRGTQHKAKGWKGTGSMTIFKVTALFLKMMLDYKKTGKDLYFDITVINEDASSSIGKQTVILKGVNLDSVIIAKLDNDSDELDEEVTFTFDDFDVQDYFKAPTLGK